MLPLPVHHPSVPESNSSLLLEPSVKGSRPDFKRSFSASASSEKTRREAKKVSSSPFTYQAITQSLLREKPLTNDQICNLITDRLSELRSSLSRAPSLYNNDRDYRRDADWNDSASFYTTSTSGRDAPRESLHAPTAREPPDKIRRPDSGLTPNTKDGGYPHLTEHPDARHEGGASQVFTPSGEATKKLGDGDGARKTRRDAELNVTGRSSRRSQDEETLRADAPPAVTEQTGQPCSRRPKTGRHVTENMYLPRKEHGPRSGGKRPTVRDPQYDDVLDEDHPGRRMMMTDGDNKLCYESVAVETASPAPGVSDPGIRRHGYKSAQAKSVSGEGDAGRGATRPYSPCILLEGEHDEDEDDDDGEWEVIPVSIYSLEFDPAERSDPDGDGEYGDKVRVSAFSKMEVFNTPVEQEQAVKLGQLSFVMPSLCGSRRRKSRQSQRMESGSEDSCDTEDSCDYSSGPEGNHLTVSRQLLDDLPETATSRHQRRNSLKGPSRRRQKAVVINLDSSDEGDGNGVKKKRWENIHVDENNVITILSDSDE